MTQTAGARGMAREEGAVGERKKNARPLTTQNHARHSSRRCPILDDGTSFRREDASSGETERDRDRGGGAVCEWESVSLSWCIDAAHAHSHTTQTAAPFQPPAPRLSSSRTR